MPRQPRLDAPGVLQHVMARGIERRKIFRDDQDRNAFLERLAVVLDETQTQCYAWTLIPNHFHLLLRTGLTPLSQVMRRLMTGYAVTFNKRHKRSGHLFQNRYKSVICEEDPYLLELIRYIHLNPLRAKLVQDLNELDKYPWTGHSAILGKRKNPLVPYASSNRKREKTEKSLAEKTVEDVLLHFGNKLREARRRYRQFVKDGVDQGTRPELQGGGLVRSAGGNKSGLLGRKKEQREKGDERILGSGDFVVQALKGANELHERSIKCWISLDELIKRVSKDRKIDTKDLISSKRKQEISNTRAIISYLAAIELRYSGAKIALALRLSEKSVSRCIERGKKLLDMDKKLLDYLQ
ncbi:MAG: transposase [Deltaproteobacteria bacterium]|nr:transposase [Deltaproteobacteria bacterium]MBW1796261.1 transposase [Deltaproteobacteria bacterium]